MSKRASKRLELAEKLLKKGRTAGAARVIRLQRLEAEKADDRETLYAISEIVRDARARLTDEEWRPFEAILAGAEEGPAHAGPLEVGLVRAGVTAVAVGVFLPLAEAENFGKIAENRLIQSGWLGWAFLGLAGATLIELGRVVRTKARSPAVVVFGLLVVVLLNLCGDER